MADMKAYEDLGIEEYQFVAALGERTCEVCGNLNGKVFNRKEASEGENYPPIHPQCRCTTVIADSEISKANTINEYTPEQQEALDKYVDKSVKGDIMKSGSDSVAKEEQRYGRNKSTAINKSYIESGDYRRKFDNITDNPVINRVIYNKAKEMLNHRSGSLFEDMYWIDGETGEIVVSALNEEEELKIKPRPAIIKAIKGRTDLIAFHTHPQSLPPSSTDFNNSFKYNYRYSIVLCHDGTIYGYSSQQPFSKALMDLYISQYTKDGLDEKEASIKALEKIASNYKIKLWEVK